MCGINGFLLPPGKTVPNGKELIAAMNKALAHRGPDDEGIWVSDDESLYLGHRRLAIIDLSSAGHQPMLSAQGHA